MRAACIHCFGPVFVFVFVFAYVVVVAFVVAFVVASDVLTGGNSGSGSALEKKRSALCGQPINFERSNWLDRNLGERRGRLWDVSGVPSNKRMIAEEPNHVRGKRTFFCEGLRVCLYKRESNSLSK